MSTKKARKNIPKKATSQPKIISLILFVIIVILWTPHTLPFLKNMASEQIFIAIALAPLAIVGLFLAYDSGISLAKYTYKQVAKGKLLAPYCILLIIHALCIWACILHEIILVGYPLKACFDACQQIELLTAIVIYAIVSSVLFLPAYYAIYRYRKWVLKYKLVNPVKK